MKRTTWFALVAAACSLLGCESGGDSAGSGALRVERTHNRPQLSGAIFTTDESGTRVNLNHFECQEDVYIDGGPPENAPSDSAALPEGCYYFQVTSPSGKTLLSSDPIECRDFCINEFGVIYDYDPDDNCAAPHDTGIDVDHEELGAITVGLAPFDPTPNPGGVYKVWVTLEEDYEPGSGKFGFIPSRSKTDNFKAGVCPPPKDHDKGKIIVCKKKVASLDPLDFEPLPNWPITLLDDEDNVVDEGYTGENGCIEFSDLEPGSYTVEEPSSLTVGSFVWGPYAGDATSKDVELEEDETEFVFFKNICVCDMKSDPECQQKTEIICPDAADPPPPVYVP